MQVKFEKSPGEMLRDNHREMNLKKNDKSTYNHQSHERQYNEYPPRNYKPFQNLIRYYEKSIKEMKDPGPKKTFTTFEIFSNEISFFK